MSLDNKSAIVTGGSSGIGQEVAVQLADRGAFVVIADVDEDGGGTTVDRISAAGGRAEFVRTDLTDEQSVEAMVARVVERHGRLDLAFNNAGIAQPTTRIDEMDTATFDRVLTVNARGAFFCLRAEIRQMRAQGGGGAIVNTASIAALYGIIGMPAYVASKHAILGLTRNAAIENVRDGIRVNAIAPGTIDTPMVGGLSDSQRKMYEELIPMGRMGHASEVAATVLFLLSEDAAFITGTVTPLDGGFSQRQ